MKIVLIGTGNVSTIIGKKLVNAGHKIIQVFGRDAAAASKLAYEFGTASTNYWSVINKDADVYIIAVADKAIDEVAKHLDIGNKIVVHTAGSIDKDVLKKISPNYGVLYPLQSLQKKNESLPDIPFFIEASNEHTQKILEQLAASISPQPVHVADAADRAKLHVAAVFVNNFTNYMYQLAEEFCKKEGLDFASLQPLIEETALRIRHTSPSQVQTGPAMRNDAATIAKHIALLEQHPQLKKVYEYLTQNITEHTK